MYRIALCDDDPAFLSSFQDRLQEALADKGVRCDVSAFSRAADLLSRLEQADAFDLLFLDIELAGENGVAVAKRIRELGARVDIVFVTVEPSYAVDGYDAAPLHFLVKPIAPDKLDCALERFLAKHEAGQLLIKRKGALVTICIDDIEYVEIFSHDLVIHACSGQPISYVGTLGELENSLRHRGFVRCHKSFMINLRHIRTIARYQIGLSDGRALPIGKARYNQVQAAFIAFTQNRLADY